MKILAQYNGFIKTSLVMAWFFGFSLGLMSFFLSPYLASVFETDNVSAVYVIAEIIALVLFARYVRLVGQWGKTFVFLLLSVLQISILAGLLGSNGEAESAFFVIGYFALVPFFMMGFDMFLEAHSKDKDTGRVQGLYLLCSSLGFVPAPAIAGAVSSAFGFQAIFFLALVCYLVVFVLATARYRKERIVPVSPKTSLFSAASRLVKHKGLSSIYFISILLEGFYVMTMMTFPLFLLDQGMTLEQNGLIFSLMVLPFLFVPYYSGRLADLLWGEKEMLILGLLVMISALVAIAFSESSALLFWAFLFFLSRIGASLVETMRNAYYYKQVGGSDVALIAFFRTARSFGILLASLVVSAILSLTQSFESVFLAYSVALFVGVIVVTKIRDTDPVNE